MKKFLGKLRKKQDLTFEESKTAFNILMNGEAAEDEIFDFQDGVYKILANDQKEHWKDIPVTWGDVDIHMMNKRSVSRVAPKIIEYYEKELNL